MPDLETMIREAAKRGELVHLSIVTVAGGFAASYTPASMYGVTHTRNADPVAAVKEAITSTKTKRTRVSKPVEDDDFG